jgi:acyl-coenzyme A synthetase/AMP-(fatty) acid ligase
MNIIDPILFQCAWQPRSAALCAPNSSIGLISYGRLAMFVHNIERTLRGHGLTPGQLIAINIKDEIFHIAVVLAATRLGVATISTSSDRVPRAVKVDALITDKPARAAGIDQIILADLSWTKGDGEPDEAPPQSPRDLCRIISTSGSTGESKAVALSHGLLAARMASHMILFGSRFLTCPRIFCDVPISTAAGFQNLISTLWRGGTFFFPGDTFEATAAIFEKYQVQGMLASPGGLEVILEGYARYPQMQSGIELVLVMGDMFPTALARRVSARICPQIVSVYGATETGTTASAPVSLLSQVPGAVGIVVPGAGIEIMDDAGAPLPRGQEGHVALKTPLAVNEYHRDPVASALSFRNQSFYPGDLGMLDAGNMLHITGRRDALVNLGGDKINPETVERALTACEGVTDCAVFGVANAVGIEELWAAIVADPNVTDEQIRSRASSHLTPKTMPVGFLRVDQLPRNAMGKLDRPRLPQLKQR